MTSNPPHTPSRPPSLAPTADVSHTARELVFPPHSDGWRWDCRVPLPLPHNQLPPGGDAGHWRQVLWAAVGEAARVPLDAACERLKTHMATTATPLAVDVEVQIDFMELLDASPELAACGLRHFDAFSLLVANTLQCAALNLQLLEPHEVGSLAPALSLLHCVPSLYNIVEINTSTMVCGVRGSVVCLAPPSIYYHASLYTCETPGCSATGQHFLANWANITRPDVCLCCTRSVVQRQNMDVFRACQKLVLQLDSCARHLHLVAAGDLVGALTLGDRLDGLMLRQHMAAGTGRGVLRETCMLLSVDELNPPMQPMGPIETPLHLTFDISYTLTVILSALDDLTPELPAVVPHVKLALLLSAVAEHLPNLQPLHILVCGWDPLCLRLPLAMVRALRLQHHTYSSGPLGAKTLRHSGSIFHAAGGLLTVQTGVVLIPGLHFMKPLQHSELAMALESHSVPLSDREKMGQGTIVAEDDVDAAAGSPMGCTVWANAHVKPASLTSLSGVFDAAKEPVFDVPHRTQETFPLLYAVLQSSTRQDDEVIAASMLAHAMGIGGDVLPQPSPASVLLENVIRQLPTSAPVASPEARSLMSAYFLASRRTRAAPSRRMAAGNHYTGMPATAGDVVQALAAAHAALCNNSAITLDDAVLAIWLYEESMVSRTGFSLLGLSASPTLLRSGLHAFGAPTVVDNFAHFRHRLLRFLPSVPGATIE